MKKFSKTLLSIFAVCISIVTMLCCFVACDNNDNSADSDDNDLGIEGNQLTFVEGTTISDILEMFDNGTITSCTYKCAKNGETVFLDKWNEFIWYGIDFTLREGQSEGLEMWTIWDENEQKCFAIDVQDGNVKYSVLKHWTSSSVIDNMKVSIELLSSSDYANSIIINNNSISIITQENVIFSWFDFNCTKVSIPDEYKNYKELAVEE
ncbi:MAG: hypothetical protein K2M36_01675 [Clostridia bacterium]|nr:hypothetical protein [Clostridia bacterium]